MRSDYRLSVRNHQIVSSGLYAHDLCAGWSSSASSIVASLNTLTLSYDRDDAIPNHFDI